MSYSVKLCTWNFIWFQKNGLDIPVIHISSIEPTFSPGQLSITLDLYVCIKMNQSWVPCERISEYSSMYLFKWLWCFEEVFKTFFDLFPFLWFDWTCIKEPKNTKLISLSLNLYFSLKDSTLHSNPRVAKLHCTLILYR